MKNLLFLAGILLFVAACSTEDEVMPTLPDQSTAVNGLAGNFYQQLALQHAPVHYQDVDPTGSHGLSGKADYITKVDFDGDFNATNNWNNIAKSQYSPTAYAYYSVTETETHYYIIYAFFHPRDWTDVWLLYHWDEHENDLEGVLTIVKKDGSTYGTAQGIVTVFHSDFYSFSVAGSGLTNGQESIDGQIQFTNDGGISRITTAAEAKGHGMKAYGPLKPGGSDYVVYYPSLTTAEQPSGIYDRSVRYKLVDIFEAGGLWQQRFNTQLFDNAKSFRKSVGNGTANAPWNWDDGNDGGGTGLYAGGMAYYPAELTDAYFNGLGNFSKKYLNNKYLGIE
jgi:hypothetical protein